MEIGTGISISWESGFLAEITDVSLGGMSRPVLKTSHMQTTDDDTFIPGDLVDNGELRVEIGFDPSATPPIANAASTLTITFPNSAASTWAFSAFMSDFEWTGPLEDLMKATCTIKATGAITITP